MPQAIDEAELREYAAGVSSRKEFDAIFDRLSGGRTRKFKVIALKPEPYLQALKQAHQAGFLEQLLEELAHAGVATSAPASVSPHMEAVTRPDLGFPIIEVEVAGKLTAARRLCCITVLDTPGGNPQRSGTGFLVGPQTVLTSYHVIAPLLDAQEAPLPHSRDRLRIAFDELNGLGGSFTAAVHDDWLVAVSRTHPLEDPLDPKPLAWESLPEDGFDKHLDFAVLRLKKTIGRERGYYQLSAASVPTVAGPGARVALIQHPEGKPLASTPGKGLRLWPGSLQTRLHHDANSTKGSSGGLLVNNEFKPIGLHQCSYWGDDDTPLFNGAITTVGILKYGQQVKPLQLDSVKGFDPVWRLSSGEPVVGREEFQQSVLDAVMGHKRILTVAGESKLGRSYSAKILHQMLGTAEHHVVELSASKLGVTARLAAHSILDAIRGTTTVVDLPDTTAADTAQAAWIAADLVPEFARRLEKLAGQRTVWLVLDDVDRYQIANTSVRVFLETVYAGMTNLPRLRILLIGLRGRPDAAIHTQVQPEELRDFGEDELARFIERESTAHGITRKKDEALKMARRILRLNQTTGIKLGKASQAAEAMEDARTP